MSPREVIGRIRSLSPSGRDLLAGVVLGIEMQLEVLLLVPEHEAAVHALLLLLAGCLALRRRFPFVTFVLAMVPFVAIQAMGADVTNSIFTGLFLCMFMAYSVAANCRGWWFWAAPPVAFGSGLLAIALDDSHEVVAGDFLWLGLVFVAGPMVAGRLVRNRGELQRALRDKAARLDRERRAEADRAVADERTRIAGDLHDIVAHALTEMTLQASAAGRLAGRDPDRARAAFAAVEDRGRDALGELRRLLGVLRAEDQEIALAPQPSLRHLDALARRAGALGLPVTVDVVGQVADLPAGIDVTGYRVVQEALHEALDLHAAGRAEVVVRYGGTSVEVEVTDDGRRAGAEAPPLGLRERVALYGGELTATPRRDGGHVMRARLPREVAA